MPGRHSIKHADTPLAARSLGSRGEAASGTVVTGHGRDRDGRNTSGGLPGQTLGPEQVSHRRLGCSQAKV